MKISLEEWKNRIRFINSNMELLNTVLPKGTNDDPFICHCNKCGGIGNYNIGQIKTAYSRKIKNPSKSDWCPICSGKKCIKGINDIATTRPDLIEYFVNQDESTKYTYQSNQYLDFKCPYCGYVKPIKICNLSNRGFCCEICSDYISYPNKICRALLAELPVDEYKIEFTSKWTNKKRYDGYFKYNNIKYLLEFDGMQHQNGNEWSTKDEQKTNDLYKDLLAKNNNYELIRINCEESDFYYIKDQIFQSKLNNIFDLKLVNWQKVLEKSLNNLMYEIIDCYHKKMPNSKIGEMLHIDRHTALRYLKRADKLGLIKYVTIREYNNQQKKRKETMKNNTTKKFYAYDINNNCVGEFYFITDCVKKLQTLTGDCISYTSIERCLRNGKSHKGFSFEFVNQDIKQIVNYDKIKEICDYFLNNQDKTNKEIANDLETSSDYIANCLNIGINIGLIDITKLESCAFKYGRFCKYKPKEVA